MNPDADSETAPTTGADDDQVHVTVKVWRGGPADSYDEILNKDPDEYRVPVVGDETYHVPHEDHVVLASDISHHGTYAFDVETDTAVKLYIETSDHVHDTIDGFEQGRAIEGGLPFTPDSDRGPFQTEIWGAIRFRVEQEL